MGDAGGGESWLLARTEDTSQAWPRQWWGGEGVLGGRQRLARKEFWGRHRGWGVSQVRVIWGQLRLGPAWRVQDGQWDESGRPRTLGQGLEGKRAGGRRWLCTETLTSTSLALLMGPR